MGRGAPSGRTAEEFPLARRDSSQPIPLGVSEVCFRDGPPGSEAIRRPVAFFGLVFLALFGERNAPHEAIYFVPEHGSDLRPYDPGLVFPFGSDVLGRDVPRGTVVVCAASINAVGRTPG